MASGSFNLNTLPQQTGMWYHTHPTLAMNIVWSCTRADASTKSTSWTVNVDVSDRPEYRNYGYTMTTTVYINGTSIGSGVVLDHSGSDWTLPPESFTATGTVDIESSTAEIKIVSSCTANCTHPSGGEDPNPDDPSAVYWVNGERTDIETVSIDPYNPHQQPSISLSLPSGVSTYTTQGSQTSVRCQWNANGDTHNHTVNIKANGTQIYNTSSSSGSGDFNQTYTTPTSRDTTYNVVGTITDDSDSSYNASSTIIRGVYGLPTVSISETSSILNSRRYKYIYNKCNRSI